VTSGGIPSNEADTPHWRGDVVVIGAGAAGMLAAATAAQRGRKTVLLEKNARPGVKILMSGGTRCNLTHACDNRGIVKAYGEQGPFLHSALAVLSPPDLVQLIEAEGVLTKVEETGKIFPVSNRAEDIVTALLSLVARCGAELRRQEPVHELSRLDACTTPHRFALRTSAGRLLLRKRDCRHGRIILSRQRDDRRRLSLG
jgi:predicted Rossmann fold flavoprotein